ncbi:MAG: hypothetical protein WC782_13175 [Methylococcaceae bacterium]|jgi:predicted component of type VI protein secretion system
MTTEARVAKEVWRFDPVSLLIMLTYLGYQLEQIFFRSHYSVCSQTRLIESVEFQAAPTKRVVITLNLGLLAGQSLLPSYFFKLVQDNSIDEQCFEDFFGYFDDRLLRRFLLAIYPECDETIYPSWDARKKIALQTLKLDSVVTLHWLSQLVFPELQVRVEKTTLERSIDLGSPILGKSLLGYQSVLGKIKKLPVAGKRITLITDEAEFKTNQPWPQEIEARLQKLMFPVLQKVELDLEIWLIIRSQSSFLSLKENSYLGYESVFSDNPQYQYIRIFSGLLSAWR